MERLATRDGYLGQIKRKTAGAKPVPAQTPGEAFLGVVCVAFLAALMIHVLA